jgi:hypothetical protein
MLTEFRSSCLITSLSVDVQFLHALMRRSFWISTSIKVAGSIPDEALAALWASTSNRNEYQESSWG